MQPAESLPFSDINVTGSYLRKIDKLLITAPGLSVLFLFPCRPTHAIHSSEDKKTSQITIQPPSVLPFLKGKAIEDRDDPRNKTLSCPLVELCVDEGYYPLGAANKQTRFTVDQLEKLLHEWVIPLSKSTVIYKSLPKGPQKDTPLTLARKLGQELQADYVAVDAVWRYKNRSGGPMVLDTPHKCLCLVSG